MSSHKRIADVTEHTNVSAAFSLLFQLLCTKGNKERDLHHRDRQVSSSHVELIIKSYQND